MKIHTTVIFLVLVTQSSASFFDTIRGAFQPLGDCVGKLYNDVVSDLKKTIDCTMMAVEHTFSWKTMFGRSAEYYEQMCIGKKNNETKSFNDAYNVASQDISAKEQSVTQLENTIEKSPADAQEIKTIEEAIFNETLRFQQIHKIICEELNKLTNNAGQTMKTSDYDDVVPSAETVLDEVKRLYEIEQLDRTSSKANEVRNTFDRVLSLLQVNDTGGGVYSDDEEVKVIMKGIAKSLGDAVDDVEKKFMEWKKENDKLQQSLRKNVTLEQMHNEISSKPDKDGSKLKRQSASFDVSSLDAYSRVESQNRSVLTHSMQSQLIPTLNQSNTQFHKTDRIKEISQSADQTSESIKTSSKVPRHNSTDSRKSLSTNQLEINQDAISLRRLLPNNYENLEQRENSLKLAEKIWNPGNHRDSNSTKYKQNKQKDSNDPEYTQLTLDGVQFQKAADILKSSHEYQLINENTRQNTTVKSHAIVGDLDISEREVIFGHPPKNPTKDGGQIIKTNNTSVVLGVIMKTNNMIKAQNNQNHTANYTNDTHSTKISNDKPENDHRQIESNRRSNNSEANESLKTSQMIRKMVNNISEDNIKPVKDLNDSQSKISESSHKNLQLNLSAAIDHSELEQEKTQSVNHSSHLSNDKYNLNTNIKNDPLLNTENNTELNAGNYQRFNTKNIAYKNQINGTKSANYPKTTQDSSNLDNSTCQNQNPVGVQENQSVNATGKLNLVQKSNDTVNTVNRNDFMQNDGQALLPNSKILLENSKHFVKGNEQILKKENINSSHDNFDLVHQKENDQLSNTRNKPQQKVLNQRSILYDPAENTSVSAHKNIYQSIQNKSDIISENDQMAENQDSNNNGHAPSSSVVNMRVSVHNTPTQERSETSNNLTNTELTNNNSLVQETGNNSAVTQEFSLPLNASTYTDLFKRNDQSLSLQKPELRDILKSNENPEVIIGKNSEPDMMKKASQLSIAENNEEKKEGNIESIFACNNQQTETILESAQNLKQKSQQHTNVEPKTDLIHKISQSSSTDNYLQTSENHDGLPASDNSNMTRKSKLNNKENKECCQPVTSPVNKDANQPVSIENKELNDKINAENSKEMISESSDVESPSQKKPEFTVVQKEGRSDQYKNRKNSDFLNKNLTTELFNAGNLPDSSIKETPLNTYNSSEYTHLNSFHGRSSQEIQNVSATLKTDELDDNYKPQNNQDLSNSSMEDTPLHICNCKSSEYMHLDNVDQQSSQEIQNVSEKLTIDASDNKYKSQNNQGDTSNRLLRSAGIQLPSELGTNDNKTLGSPQQEVSQEFNYSIILPTIKESTNSSNEPVSQTAHNNDNNESLDENLKLPQNNAVVVSQQLRENNLQTVADSAELSQESYASQVVQAQRPSENRIEYSTVTSILNSPEDEIVTSPTLNTYSTEPVHSFEEQNTDDNSYVPSPRFNHVIHQQKTSIEKLETEFGLVCDSNYSNQNQYVPNLEFNTFDQTIQSDLTPRWQEDDTSYKINEDNQQEPLWSSYTEDYFSKEYMSTEKPESLEFLTDPMFDIESIIQDSQRSESLMENLFSNMDHEHNVFEEPDMVY